MCFKWSLHPPPQSHTIFTELSEFNGICIDSSGHIIVSDWQYGVYVFIASGECVGHVSSHVIPDPAGVSVDEDGFVYVCSFVGHEVVVV